MSKHQFAEFLKRNETPHEHILWQVLQKKRLCGIHFARQVPVLGWIADFMAPSIRLLIEVDGKNHSYGKQKRKDHFRDRALAAAGFSTLRFTNKEILYALPYVVQTIKCVCKRYSDAKPKKDIR